VRKGDKVEQDDKALLRCLTAGSAIVKKETTLDGLRPSLKSRV